MESNSFPQAYRVVSSAKLQISVSSVSVTNLASHYIKCTCKEILALKKLYCCFEVFFLLEILLRTLAMLVLGETSLVLRFSKYFLADLKCPRGYWNILYLFDFAYFVF